LYRVEVIDRLKAGRPIACVILLLASLAATGGSAGASLAPSTDEMKAQFVYNFIRFVDWPEGAFAGESEALRVAIIGGDPFNGWLDRTLAGKVVNKHHIVISRALEPPVAPLPHVAVIDRSQDAHLAGVLAAYCRTPVLTLSDIDRFASRGGVIGLVVDGDVVHFGVNRTAAEEARLRVPAQLLYLAVPLFSSVSPCRTQ
jgi:hypothetical protein